MSRNLVKFYNANEQEESKIIDSNALMEKKLQEIAAEARRKPRPASSNMEVASENAEAGFVEGLGAEEFDALMMDDGEGGNVIKAVNPEEEAGRIIQEARDKADEIVATAEQLAMEYKNNSRREAEIEGTRIKADAKNEGYREGLAQAEAEYQSRYAELAATEQSLLQEFDELCSSLEPQFINTITGIYEHIFKVSFAEYAQVVAQLVSDTIRRVETSGSYIVHISAEDYPTIDSTKREEIEAAAPGCKVEIVEDIGLGRNQCMLETDNGIFDCGLDTQLRELRKKLMILSYRPSSEN